MALKKLEEEKFMLHKIMHNTNIQNPRSDYIGLHKYPNQNALICLTFKKLKYRDMNYTNRPIEGSETEEENEILEKEFLIIRCDDTEPYVMIGISLDTEMTVLVTDSRQYESIVCQCPLQFEECIGIKGEIRFSENESKDGFVIRADHGEPCKAVIINYTSEDFFYCYTGDEVVFKTDSESDIHSKEDIVKIFENLANLPDYRKMLIFL